MITMSHTCYCRPSRRWSRVRGFKLHPGRFSLHRLRVRFFQLIKLFNRWKILFCKAMESLNMNKAAGKKSWARRRDIESRRGLVGKGGRVRQSRTDYKLMSYARSNSFYAEAIAECLEFIKRTSVSVDEESVLVSH